MHLMSNSSDFHVSLDLNTERVSQWMTLAQGQVLSMGNHSIMHTQNAQKPIGP